MVRFAVGNVHSTSWISEVLVSSIILDPDRFWQHKCTETAIKICVFYVMSSAARQ